MKKEICHVCGKEKKPYTVFMEDSIFSFLNYEQARENGAICERCDKYFAMTGEFKDASEEEFELAKKSVEFARMLLKWWEKDEKMSEDKDNKRDWEGTETIAKWCRDVLNSNSEPKGSTHKCFVCEKECPCDCLEIDTDYGCIYFCSMKCYRKSNSECDWDAEFGEFKGHYYNCELGGDFKKKWKKALKEEALYRKLYFDFHAKWKALKYPDDKKSGVTSDNT